MSESDDLPPLLLCLDLEAGSRELACEAARYAARCHMPVRVVHVLQSPLDRRDRAGRLERLQALCHKLLPEVPETHIHLEEGVPEECIVAVAEHYSTGPILLGRRRRQTVERIYVGSTTSAVISLAQRPVLVIPLPVDHP
ncbi:MAG TPA: universal stress protein [Thiotrichales bacterium]|nr:universal stress protein [Thiotrichales bacterium]